MAVVCRENAQELIRSIEELTLFLESKLDSKPKKQKLNIKAIKKKKRTEKANNKRKFKYDKKRSNIKHQQIDIDVINMHLSVVNKSKYNEEKKLVQDQDDQKYSELIDPNKNTDLYLEWKNDFCLSYESEHHLLDWMLTQFPYKKYGFSDIKDKHIKSFIKQQKLYDTDKDVANIKSDITNKCIIEYDTDLLVKTINKFYDFRMRHFCLLLNKTMNMFFRNEMEKKWWNQQLDDMNKINANEWFDKCIKWKIAPSRLLKDFIAAKKLFINDYTLSHDFPKFSQQYMDYYNDRDDLEDKDYFAPLGKYEDRDPNHQKDPVREQLKSNRNRGYKNINTFLNEIGKIPYSKGGYDAFFICNDENAKLKQYSIYDKWIKYSHMVHRIKWMRYLKKKANTDTQNMKNGIWNEPIEKLMEYPEDKQKENDYTIPGINNLLTRDICEEMCKILLMDGVLGINTMTKSRTNASKYEDFVFDAIKTVFDNRSNKEDGAKMMNEWDVRLSNCPNVTPDVLFNHSININGVDIYWMDMKHFYVTSLEPITFRSMGHQMLNYVTNFGNGAIVCCGFQSDFVERLKERYPEITGTILMLDASSWYQYAKEKR